MPRGRPKKAKKDQPEAGVESPGTGPTDETVLKPKEAAPENPPPPTPPPPPVETQKPVDPWQAAIAESRELLNTPLAPGQAFFESPEGFIMIDQADRDRVWCRQANKGVGMWINPKRD